MSKIKTITATTTEQTITFDATYQFVWFRSLGNGDVLVSDHSGIVAGTDDVALVKGGDSTRITVPYNKTVYVKAVSDSVDMEIHAQNFSDAPFEGGSGGSGGSITIDPTPTQGSSNAVSSGGVYTALQGVGVCTETTLYSGGTASNTEFNLTDSIANYDAIHVISTCMESENNYYVTNTFSASELLAHAGTTDRFAVTTDSWFSYFSVETASKFIKEDTYRLYISKIIGIKIGGAVSNAN